MKKSFERKNTIFRKNYRYPMMGMSVQFNYNIVNYTILYVMNIDKYMYIYIKLFTHK